MARDAATDALHRLFVAEAHYQAATAAKAKARLIFNKAIADAVDAGLSKADIGRAIGLSDARIHQILGESV